MKKEKYIREEKKKNGICFHVDVSFRSDGQLRHIDGGRFYVADYATPSEAQKAAKSARDRILRQIDNDRPIRRYPTVSELYAKKFELIPCSLGTKTRHQHFYDFAIAQYGSKPIDKVTAADVQMSVNQYAETHSSDQVNRLLTVWKQIYRTALLMQIPVVDRSQMVIVPKSKVIARKRNQDIDYDSLVKFMDALKKYNHSAVRSELVWNACMLMLFLGTRPAETFAISKEDVDLKQNIIRIRSAVGSSKNERRQIVPVKTAKARRDIPIDARLKPLLLDLMAGAEDLLVPDVDGGPFDIIVFSDYMNRVSHSCGISMTAYKFRHYFATSLFASDVNPKIIQDLLGHEKIQMSAYYAFTQEKDRKSAIENRKFS